MRSSRRKSEGGKNKKNNKGNSPKITSERHGKTVGRGKNVPPSKYVKNKDKGEPLPKFSDEVRLNKYLSNAGICSRREADTLIATGVVSVNGEIITEMGYKIKPSDVVKYDGHSVNTATKRYVLLNKPKDFVCSNDDAWGRKTVLSLVAKACKESVFPVDKLDREVTGLLLLTNDSDMIKKLTHPKFKVSQLFQVSLDKSMQPEHMKLIEEEGVFLDTTKLKVDAISYIEGKSNHEVGVEIKSPKYKTVIRIFEKLGYKVLKLDRVKYAGLTKKDLPRGMYRHLTANEVSFLKMN